MIELALVSSSANLLQLISQWEPGRQGIFSPGIAKCQMVLDSISHRGIQELASLIYDLPNLGIKLEEGD